MKTSEDILSTEFSEKFIDKMKNRMIVSYYKYGSVRDNSGDKLVNEMESMKLRIKKYEETGNTEYLVDIANFAMIEYMYPQHEKAHFEATDSDKSPGLIGMSINEIKRFGEKEEK